MVMKKIIAVAALSLVALTFSYAQRHMAGIDGREVMQRQRIHQGRTNGDLTHREAMRLNRQQRHIHRDERRVRADGTVTRRERLRHEQNRASRNIRRQKHDQQVNGSIN